MMSDRVQLEFVLRRALHRAGIVDRLAPQVPPQGLRLRRVRRRTTTFAGVPAAT